VTLRGPLPEGWFVYGQSGGHLLNLSAAYNDAGEYLEYEFAGIPDNVIPWVRYSADGEFVCAFWPGGLVVRHRRTNESVFQLQRAGIVDCMIAPAGNRVAVRLGGRVELWSMFDSRIVAEHNVPPSFDIEFTGDGRWLVMAGSGRVGSIDAENGRRGLSVALRGFRGLITSRSSGTFAVLEDGSNSPFYIFDGAREVYSGVGGLMELSPDGRHYFARRGGGVEVRDAASGRIMAHFSIDPHRVSELHAHPDGVRVIAFHDGHGYTVLNWRTGRVLAERVHAAPFDLSSAPRDFVVFNEMGTRFARGRNDQGNGIVIDEITSTGLSFRELIADICSTYLPLGGRHFSSADMRQSALLREAWRGEGDLGQDVCIAANHLR
jgi:hypothetical protein